jgi:hypothetical protein
MRCGLPPGKLPWLCISVRCAVGCGRHAASAAIEHNLALVVEAELGWHFVLKETRREMQDDACIPGTTVWLRASWALQPMGTRVESRARREKWGRPRTATSLTTLLIPALRAPCQQTEHRWAWPSSYCGRRMYCCGPFGGSSGCILRNPDDRSRIWDAASDSARALGPSTAPVTFPVAWGRGSRRSGIHTAATQGARLLALRVGEGAVHGAVK